LCYFFIFEAFLLAAAISVDALAASFAYGSQKIRVGLRALIVISLICSGILGLTLYLGEWIGGFIGEGTAAALSFTILFTLGITRIFDSWLKRWIRRRGDGGGQIKFSAFRLKFILQVYADPQSADADGSRTLSSGEAATLAFALSLDGIAAGLGAGLMGAGAGLATGMAFVLTLVAVTLGCRLGDRFAAGRNRDISWLGGALLIALAVLALV